MMNNGDNIINTLEQKYNDQNKIDNGINEITNEEIFFEAQETLRELYIEETPMDKKLENNEYNSPNILVRRFKSTYSKEQNILNYFQSNNSTKQTEMTLYREQINKLKKSISHNNFTNFNEIAFKTKSKSPSPEKKVNFSKTQNESFPMININNNNINTMPKINLSFNINFNCQNKVIKEEIQYENNKIDTIYETSRQETEIKNDKLSEILNDTSLSKIRKQNDYISNIPTLNGETDKSFNFMVNSIYRKDNSSSINQIKKIKFEFKNEIDINYMRKNLKNLNIKFKQTSNNNKHFRNIFELQNFEIDTQQIWIVKISFDGRYIATGGKSGILKIFEILDYENENYKKVYTLDNIFSYLNFMNEKPYRIYNDHSNDIIDICWSPKNRNTLLSASLDHLVILWNLESEYPICKFNHSSIVTCICFNPFYQNSENEEVFVSGCLDKYIRVWSINKNKVLDYTNIKEYITAISYFPTGDMIVVGTHNGRCSVYDCNPKLRYNFSFSCRNRMGKYYKGRKITNIEFINRSQALITTNDSRIRLVNISDGKMIQKYKSHVNEEYMIKSFADETNDLIISASEDGFVYVWNKFNKESNDKKNYSCEMFKPFIKDTSSCSLFVNDICTAHYLKKMFNVSTKVMVFSIVINASVGGKLQVLLNCDEI